MKRLTWWRRGLMWLGRAELRAPGVEAVELAFDKVRVSRNLALDAARDFLEAVDRGECLPPAGSSCEAEVERICRGEES